MGLNLEYTIFLATGMKANPGSNIILKKKKFNHVFKGHLNVHGVAEHKITYEISESGLVN